jgi:hypothetical protein
MCNISVLYLMLLHNNPTSFAHKVVSTAAIRLIVFIIVASPVSFGVDLFSLTPCKTRFNILFLYGTRLARACRVYSVCRLLTSVFYGVVSCALKSLVV